ncbi:MAG: hypothetical protein HN796_06935, partial [Gemmatimonadetes bacterium]|nr:hypothetical protein [Gemmatimonadota bacterium]
AQDESAQMDPSAKDVPAAHDSGHEDSQAQAAEPAQIKAVPLDPVPEPVPDVDLEGLITQVATGDAEVRARSATQLRALVPGSDGIELLFDLASRDGDPRRLPAIQALGHHRQWMSTRTRVETILKLARAERDPEIAAALVWTLRQREELREFLLHTMHTVAREAALGVPVSHSTVEAIVHAMLVGRAPDVDMILAQKLPAMHASHTKMAIDILQVMASFSSTEEQRLVVENLPQPPLFEAFVEGRSRPALNPEPTEGETLALKQWHDLSRLTSQALLDRPGADLIRYLVNRCAADEPFARRHAGFLQKAMAGTRDTLGAEVLDDFERLTQGATEERIERMALLLMELVDKIAGGESHSQASDLLEKWKSHSPALKLKIYHMQQGLR